MKTPSLKTPPDITINTPSKPPPEENSEENEDSQLERKIQKWKSLYRNEKQTEEESDGVKNSGNLPGLKEAHKQLSLENYKLKKAYSDIQKQLDLMKVMSWYRRAQVDKLKQNGQLNTSHVVDILKKELQYLETVYFREKRLADMWRNEEKEKPESSANTWKYFKDRWNKKYQDESYKEGVCMDKRDCGGETGTVEDTSGSNNKESVVGGGTLDIPTTEDNELPKRKQGEDSAVLTNTESSDYAGSQNDANAASWYPHRRTKNVAREKTGTKGDFGTVDDTTFSNKDEIQHQHEKVENLMDHRGNEKDSLLWRHLRLAKSVEDDEKDQIRLLSEAVASGYNTAQTNDKNELSEDDSSNGSVGEQTNNLGGQQSDTTTNNEGSSTGLLPQIESGWFSYEVVEEDGDIVIAYENKDSVPHVLYGFVDGKFQEIESKPGHVFVMSIKRECFDVNSSFVVSLLNNSPKPIQFFALLPNGKIKHQKIVEQVQVTIVELGSKDGEEGEAQPLIYEATVMENGKLKVTKQNDDGESHEQNKYQDEGSNTEVESRDGNVVTEQNHDKFGVENAEYLDESSKNHDENGDGQLDVMDHDDGESGKNGEYLEGSKNDDQSGDENNVENNEHQNSEQRQENPEETLQPNQEVPLSDLTPGESYFFDPHTAKIYRHTVSAHQYPISDYETLLTKIHTKLEQVYYRFPRNMIIEKFIVKDEVVKMNADGSIRKGEDDEGPVRDTVRNVEPVEYEEEVSDIIQQLLKNPWRNGRRIPILITYDSETGTITSIYVTLSKVQSDDVISHDVLKYGKIETFGENIKITSYLLYGNELLRIVREDEVKHGFAKIAEEETHGEVDGNFETGDQISRKPENEEENYGNSKNEDENQENENENSSNLENENMQERNADDFHNGNGSQSTPLEDGQQESQNDECTLTLGDSQTTEYWSYTVQRGATVIRVTVERLMPTTNFKKEDLEKLKISTNDIEESVSYIYCDDGSVQKTWQTIEKGSGNRESEESGKDTKNDDRGERSGADDSESLRDNWMDDDDYEYGGDEEYGENIDDDLDYDYEHDDMDDHIDDVDEDDPDNDDEGYDEYDDLDDDIENQPENDYQANDPDYGVDEDIGDNDNTDNKTNPEPETNEESKKLNVQESSNDPESTYNYRKTKDLDKENYEMFITREWQELKLRQQQFEHSKKQNMRLQQQILEEWNKMKQQYKKFEENFQKNQKSERDVEIEGIWTDLKHQQKQFENMKKQIEEELKKRLQEEWEKLKERQADIESREKQLYVDDDETMVRYQEVVGYQRVKVDDEQQGTRWGPNNDDTLIPKLQPQVTPEKENKYHSEIEATTEFEMELNNQDPNPEIQESTDKIVTASWQSRAVEDSYVDTIQSDAWQMSESHTAYTQDMHMEENLPHELPYIPKTDEKPDYRVDKMLNEAWELSQETSNTYEEKYTTEEDLPHEIPYIPESSEITGATDSIFRIREMQQKYQGETFSEEIPYEVPVARNEIPRVGEDIFNIVTRQNMDQEEAFPDIVPYTSSMETTSQSDNIISNEYNEHTVDISEDALPDFETEDTQSSSQWELQITKLREELDRLYEAKKSQRNGLQVVKNEIESPVKPTEDLSSKSESMVQPKCAPKSPSTPGNSECSPKCPKSDSTEDVSPIDHRPLPPNEYKAKPKPESFRKTSEEKTKPSSFSKKSDREMKPSKIEKDEEKRESPAFMDYIEANSYLRQLEPEEYDHKMPRLNNGPPDLRKKTRKRKKEKPKFTDESEDKSKSIEKNRKERNEEKYWKKKVQEDELDEPFRKGKKKIKNNYPLSPQRKTKSARKDNKSNREKSM